jgi:hypothetical protein
MINNAIFQDDRVKPVEAGKSAPKKMNYVDLCGTLRYNCGDNQ